MVIGAATIRLASTSARVRRRGYADATLDDIAAEAGVSKPTVYQYVASKQRLLETIVEQAIYGCSQDKPNTRHGRFLKLGAGPGELRMRRPGRCPGER
jgi:AcrR family transcriptional regulator